MTDTNTETGQQVRPFAAMLQDLDNGSVSDQLASDMQALVTAVQDEGRKGSVTLKIEVSPRKGGNALNVAASVVTKLPAPEPTESVFFADGSGNLLRDDPRQMSIPLREVDRPETPAALRRAGS
jgi:hypothetical protein